MSLPDLVQLPLFPTGSKKCGDCGQLLRLDAFGKDRYQRDGLRWICRACAKVRRDHWMASEDYRAWRKRYNVAYRDVISARNKAYIAAHPEKPAQYASAWRRRHPEKVREGLRAYLAKNRERANIWQRTYKALRKKAPGTHTKEDLDALFAQQSGRCAYCNALLAWPIHVDHKIPLSRGGSNWPDNLCLACEGCNKRKWRMTDAEYRALLERQP